MDEEKEKEDVTPLSRERNCCLIPCGVHCFGFEPVSLASGVLPRHHIIGGRGHGGVCPDLCHPPIRATGVIVDTPRADPLWWQPAALYDFIQFLLRRIFLCTYFRK